MQTFLLHWGNLDNTSQLGASVVKPDHSYVTQSPVFSASVYFKTRLDHRFQNTRVRHNPEVACNFRCQMK